MIFYWTIPGVVPRYWLTQWAPGGVHPSYFVLTALFLHGWHPYTFNSVVPGGWSIAVEMTFYLIFPVLFHFLNSLRRAAAAVLAAIVYTKLEEHLNVFIHAHLFPTTTDFVYSFFYPTWFPAQVGVFLIGILTYHVLREPAIKALLQSRTAAMLLLGFALVLLPGFLLETNSGKSVSPQLLVSGAFALLVMALSSPRLPLLVNPLICGLGRLSYSCYLVHFAALALILRLFGISQTADHPLYDAGGGMRNFLLFAGLFFGSLALTVIGATLTLHAIEKPGIDLGRRALRLLGTGREQPAPSRPAVGDLPG